MWLYTLFVGSATAIPLGSLYVAGRAIYPICYAAPGEFSWILELVVSSTP